MKSVYAAAALFGAIALTPVAGLAQNDQLRDELRPRLVDLGIDASQMEKLDTATDEQLTRLEEIVAGEGSDMTKQDEINAVLNESE